MLPFCFVLLYDFPEALTAKTVVVLSEHRDGIHKQSEHEPSFQPEGMCLGSSIYNQLVDGDARMEPLIS